MKIPHNLPEGWRAWLYHANADWYFKQLAGDLQKDRCKWRIYWVKVLEFFQKAIDKLYSRIVR